MSRVVSSCVVLFLAITASISAAQEFQTEQDSARNRLQISPNDQAEQQPIRIEGRVKVQNKYSIVVDAGDSEILVNVSDKTRVVLKIAGPRIDFSKKQLIISVEDGNKEFKGYKFKTPLFIRVDFAHKNQFNRIMGMKEKRLSNYTLSQQRPTSPQGKGTFFLVGELAEGASNRQVKLKTDNLTHEVILAKRGRFEGFSVADLTAGKTRVQVTGISRGGKTDAVEILFWPATKPSATEPPTDKSREGLQKPGQ